MAQTGQSEAIHSPEACASMVVRLTRPAVWSMAVVYTVAISCWPRVLRTISSPLDNGAYPMAKARKDTLGVSKVTGVADAGYSSGTAAAACEADGITACVPTNRSIHSQGNGTMFGRSAFIYHPE